MDYSITKDELYGRRSSLFENLVTLLTGKKKLVKQLDSLRADHAMTLDQCQLMKEHIQNLETKIDSINAAMDLRPETSEPEMPYSSAIVLAKRGCGKDEIRQACGLTDSEADLILALHKKTQNPAQSNVLAN